MPLELPIESLAKLLSPIAQASLTENLIIVSVVMWTVRGHFRRIEGQLEKLSAALISLEKNQTERLNQFDSRLTKLEKH